MNYYRRQQGGAQQELMQGIMQALEEGRQPEEIVEMLVNMGIAQEEAVQMIQMVMEQLQGQAPQPGSEMMPPEAASPAMAAQGIPEATYSEAMGPEGMMPPTGEEQGMPPMARYGRALRRAQEGAASQTMTPFQQYLINYPSAPASDTLVSTPGWSDPREEDFGWNRGTPRSEALKAAYDKTYGEYDDFDELTPENEAERRIKRAGGMYRAQMGYANPMALQRFISNDLMKDPAMEYAQNAARSTGLPQRNSGGGYYKEMYLTGGQAAALARQGYIVEEM